MKNIKFFFIIMILFSIPSKVFPEVSTTKADLSTPFGTVYTHLSFLQSDKYFPKIAGKPFLINDITSKESEILAQKLLKILDGRQLFVIMKNVPKESDYIDSVTGDHKFYLFRSEPWLYLEKKGDKWLYSETTILQIPEQFNKTYPFNLNKITDYLPSFMMYDFLSLKLWQWSGLLLLLIISIFIFYILNWIFGYFLKKIFIRFARTETFGAYIVKIAKPLSVLFIILLWMIFLGVLQLPIQIGYHISLFLKVLYPVFITIIIYRLSDFFTDVLEVMAMKTKTTVDDHLIPLVRKTLKIIIIALGSIYIINNMGINITPLLAGASIGGLAIALAAKDTLSNFFGSITIFTDQPFEVGDWIVFNGIEGTVEEVGVRSTRIRTFYNSQISVPNGKLADAIIDNMGRREYRRFVAKIGLTYDTKPEAFDAFVEGLKSIVENHPDTRKDYYQIHLNEFGESSINVLFYIFFKSKDWTAELESKHEVMNEIIKLANILGVRFAFPTQTLHIEEMPGQTSLTPKQNHTYDDLSKIKNEFSQLQEKKWKEREASKLDDNS